MSFRVCAFIPKKWNLRPRFRHLFQLRASLSFINHLLDITLLIYKAPLSNQAFFVNHHKTVFDLKLNTSRASPNPICHLRGWANLDSNNCYSDIRANLLFPIFIVSDFQWHLYTENSTENLNQSPSEFQNTQ